MKKFVTVVFNIIFTITTIVIFLFISYYFKDEKIADIYNSPNFEKSDRFSYITNTKLRDIFLYIQNPNDSNLKFKTDGKTSNLHYIVTFSNNITVNKYSNTIKEIDDLLESEAFIYISNKDSIVSSNINKVTNATLVDLNNVNPYPSSIYSLYAAVDTNYPINDEYKQSAIAYYEKKVLATNLMFALAISSILFIFTMLLSLFLFLNSTKKLDENHSIIDVIPTEIYALTLITLFSFCFMYIKTYPFSIYFASDEIKTIKPYIYISLIYIFIIFFLYILSVKYEHDSATPITIRMISRRVSTTSSYRTIRFMFFLIILPIIVIIIISIYLIYQYVINKNLLFLYIGGILLISVFWFAIYLVYLFTKVDTAFKDQKRANDMKAALISNVTHDIKTPLTSILNYTELMAIEVAKQNNEENDILKKYSDVIINKSSRLNDLINDLIFDSKASSGNIPMIMEKINLNEFVSQVIVEFEDKLLENGIKVIKETDDEQIYINADSKQLYRVFQNLFTNIFKYALENSRVYITIKTTNNKVDIMVKNIEKEAPEVAADTLVERFVRGNKSRSTEGFGLGLSISENLVNAMQGEFSVKSIQDEFIVNIKFIRYDE